MGTLVKILLVKSDNREEKYLTLKFPVPRTASTYSAMDPALVLIATTQCISSVSRSLFSWIIRQQMPLAANLSTDEHLIVGRAGC